MIAAVQKIMAPVMRRVRLMVGLAVLSALNDAHKMQRAQVKLLAGEVRDGADRYQNYGHTSVPLAGAEGVFLAVGGNRDRGVLVAVDDRRYRPTGLAAGESCLYTILDKLGTGHRVYLRADGWVVIRAKGVLIEAAEKVRMDTPLLEVTGEIRDLCDTGGRTMSAMRDTYDGHTHNENDVTGSPTAAPNQTM
jgi:phage baseplate assembly protein V